MSSARLATKEGIVLFFLFLFFTTPQKSESYTVKESKKAVKELVIEDFFWGESNVALQSFLGRSHVGRMWLLVTIGIQKGTVLSIYFRKIKKSIKVTNQSWELNPNKLLPY